MPAALVTGVTGQDGSYLAERLLGEGWQVHGLVRASVDPDEHPLPDGVRAHRGDLRDPGLWPGLLDAVRPDVVYHLAGLTSVGRSWAEPLATAETTGLAAVRLQVAVEEAGRAGREVRLLQASSAEMFAGSGVVPQTEDTPIRPLSPYGAAKAYAHLSARVYRERGIWVSTAILYNHESPRRPPAFVTRKITSGVAAIAQGRAEHLTLGNLDVRRDWGWAPDYVDAMIRIMAHPDPDDYIVATGESHTVADFAAAAFGAAGIDDWRAHVRVDPALVRPNDEAELRGDATRARSRLGWQPTVRFREVVARLVAADLDAAVS